MLKFQPKIDVLAARVRKDNLRVICFSSLWAIKVLCLNSPGLQKLRCHSRSKACFFVPEKFIILPHDKATILICTIKVCAALVDVATSTGTNADDGFIKLKTAPLVVCHFGDCFDQFPDISRDTVHKLGSSAFAPCDLC